MRKPKQYVVHITAIIGCLTGVTSLSWQIWKHYQPPTDLIAVSYSIGVQLGDIDGDGWPDNSFEIMVSITNESSHPTYLSRCDLMWERSPGKWNSLRFGFGEYDFSEALKPGQRKVYVHKIPIEDTEQYLQRFGNSAKIIVATTRGTVVIFDDLGPRFASLVGDRPLAAQRTLQVAPAGAAQTFER